MTEADLITELLAEVASLRETNRKLNRRCQEAESDAVQARNDLVAQGTLLSDAVSVAGKYAGQLRSLYKSRRRELREFYQKPVYRLPKPPGDDGPEQRVDHALTLIEAGVAQLAERSA